MNLVRAFVVVLIVASSIGCSSNEKNGGAPEGGAPVLRVATYNAGLLDSVGYVRERLPLVTKALAVTST